MGKCVILVDNSNVFIEGQKFSARQKGLAPLPGGKSPQDLSWRIIFGDLLAQLANGRPIHSAILVGSRPPPNDNVWESAKQKGFSVTLHDRGANNKEKVVDTELVAQGTEIICSTSEVMTLIIASGDRDFIPLVKVAQRKGWDVEMCAFTSAFTQDGQMAQTVNQVRPLDAVFALIGHCDLVWPHSGRCYSFLYFAYPIQNGLGFSPLGDSLRAPVPGCSRGHGARHPAKATLHMVGLPTHITAGILSKNEW